MHSSISIVLDLDACRVSWPLAALGMAYVLQVAQCEPAFQSAYVRSGFQW
jgi:hypothetical protein